MADESRKSIVSQNTTEAIYGLNTDSILQQTKEGQLTYALNAQIDSFDGNMITYQNEQSNILCSEFKTGYKVIKYHSILEQKKIILFLVNPSTKQSEIGVITDNGTCNSDDPTNLNKVENIDYVNNGYNNIDCNCSIDKEPEIISFYDLYNKNNSTNLSNSCCVYETLINSICLNFDLYDPISDIIHRVVTKDDDGFCGTEIYWSDSSGRRYLNLDNLPFKEEIINCERVKTDIVDCGLLDVQSKFNIPKIKPIFETSGGSITAGTVQFSIAYTNNKGDVFTSYYGVTNPISIFQDKVGLDYNFPTDKSIKLEISNLDTSFSYFNLAVIKTVNGISDVEIVGTYEIINSVKQITYTGNNKTQLNITIDDIFQKYPIYGSAKNVNIVDNTLVWSNLVSDERINYQSIANKIHLKWGTTQIPYNVNQGYNNGINTALYKGYMRDEVYAIEFVPILKSGKQCDGFHIPARVSNSNDLLPILNGDVVVKELDSCIVESYTQPKWKVYNTGTKIGFETQYTNATNQNCYIGPYEYGEFSYYESEIKYPCNKKIWGELSDTPIRHHKFPDNLITHIHNNNPNTEDKEFEHKIYPIGIRIDLENIRQAILTSDLTEKQKSDIIGYKIIRSDRVNNKSVIAKGLLYNMGAYIPYSGGVATPNQETLYPNYPFNDLGTDPFLTNLDNLNDGGGFSINTLGEIEFQVDTIQQQIDSLLALMTSIKAVVYTDDGTPGGIVIIDITNSEINDLINDLNIAKINGQLILDDINRIQNYYNDKIQTGGKICQTDVASLTLNSTYLTNYNTNINDINGDPAISHFTNVVNYINTNSVTLSSNVNANSIFELKNNLVNLLILNSNLVADQTTKNTSITNYNNTLTTLSSIDCSDNINNTNTFSKTRFTFHSPDTHFYQPFLGSIIKFETLEGGVSIGNFVQVKNHAGNKLISSFSSGIALVAGIAVGALFAFEPRAHFIQGFGSGYTAYYPDIPSFGTIAEKSLFWNKEFKTLIMNLIPYKNYAYQYNAIGLYNTSLGIPNDGFKQRMLDKAYYLLPGQQALGDQFPINNWNRESSVFFRTSQTNSSPLYPNDVLILGGLQEDNSRVPYNSNKQIYSNILSYYASNKRKVLDQYGEIYSYETVDTGYNGEIDLDKNYTNISANIFGGDIFINRFGLKRKLSYFIDNLVNKPDGSDIDYSDLSNIGKVRYWYNTSSSQSPGSGFKGLMKSILGAPQSNLDGNTNKLFYQNGKIYLYSYGIAYFFTESEVNTDYRQAGNREEKDFYPHVGSGIPNDWLQETLVPIVNDNYYIYNKTYSKQNKENYFTHLPISFDPNDKCIQDFSYRAIYSDKHKYRTYKPISYFDFPRNHGKLTSIDTIDNTQVLVRFENKSYIYNALTTIQTSSSKYAYLGNDDVFRSQPIDFGETDLGYAGSQHKLLLRTEAGHLYIDAKRGKIFLIQGSNISCISNTGMSKWFLNNLPFEINKKYPNINIDNSFNGIGIIGVWDSTYNRFIITKLDYIPINKDLLYDNGFYFEKEISVTECRPGYNLINGMCTKDALVPAERVGNLPPFVAVSRTSNVYAYIGSCIYDVGFSANGTGTYTDIDNTVTNDIWRSVAGSGGPVNRLGIWNSLSDNPLNEWVGVTKVVNAPISKTYYIGVAGDNLAKIKIGCDTIVVFDPNAMAINHGSESQITFTKFHIYPVTLQAGENFIELYGLNIGSIAVFAAEIYDNTKQKLMTATSLSELTILFSTNELIGQSITNFNFTCPDCQAPINTGEDEYFCKYIDVVSPSTYKKKIRNEVLLGDPRYFVDKSWTISYSPIINAWVSYHSYIPNYYIGQDGRFLTGSNNIFSNQKSSIWKHNSIYTSYQTFYGVFSPYVIEYPLSYKGNEEIVNSISDYTTILEYYNKTDYYEVNDNVYFNKTILYNNQQCSGVRNLYPKPKGKLNLYFNYPKINKDSIDIIYTKSDNIFSYNTLWDTVKNPNNHFPIFTETGENKSIGKVLNNDKLDYSSRSHQKTKLRSKDIKIRHINDKFNRYKFISKFINLESELSQ